MTIEEKRKRASQCQISWQRRLKEKAVAYKGGHCQKCGYSRCIGALEFHHLDPKQKSFSIGRMRRAWDKVRIELDKTILVCANCHRELEAGIS